MSSDTPLDAYWRFFESFNSRDPETFSAALHYPHVRISSRGTPTIVPSLAEHAAGMSYDRVLATGWDHTNGHEPEIIHRSSDRWHIAGGWTRVDARGGSVLVNRVTYIVTRAEHPRGAAAEGARDAGWGIQCRFGTDSGSADDAGETDAHRARAVTLVEDYINAYNDRDWAQCAQIMMTPHFKIDVGMVRQWTDRSSLQATFRDGPWHFVTERSVQAVQGGANSVTVAVDGLLGGGDHAVQGTFFVTNKNGWGIQARSVIESRLP